MIISQALRTRLKIIAENRDEYDKLIGMKMLHKDDMNFSCSDSLVNRYLLNFEVDKIEKDKCLPQLEIVNSPLRPYQIKDVQTMLSWRSLINANDMGLGKTLETIYYCKLANFNKVLIICPKAVLAHWKNQFHQWYPEITVEILPNRIKSNVVIVNYEQVRIHPELYSKTKWDLIVCDEAHKIKNHKSQIGKLIHKIPALNRLALTGTPIINYVDDMYNILFWVDSRALGEGYWRFVDLFCHVPYNPFGEVIEGLTKDVHRVELLKKVLSNYVIRSTKEEVLTDLPKKGIYDITLAFSKAQRELYDDVKKLVFEKLPKNCTISNAAIHLLRLIQVTSNPALFNDKINNPKFEYILELLEENPDKSLVVFTQFAQTVEALTHYLRLAEIGCTSITGSDTIMHRLIGVQKFIHKESRVIIGTIGAMGQGIDGLQNVCSTVIFIDSSWSPQINAQAEDRVYRFGQKLPVDVYYLRLEKSVDQLVGKRVLNKELDVRELL